MHHLFVTFLTLSLSRVGGGGMPLFCLKLYELQLDIVFGIEI